MCNIRTIEIKVEFCSQCPYCTLYGPYCEPDDDFEDLYDLYCRQLKKDVHQGLDWYNIASKHTNKDNNMDTIPDECPLQTQELYESI